jgi:hypothetical protein
MAGVEARHAARAMPPMAVRISVDGERSFRLNVNTDFG